MAPKRNTKAKAPVVAVATEESKAKSRKRGAKVLNEEQEENLEVVESVENGKNGNHSPPPDVIQPIQRKGRKANKTKKTDEIRENTPDEPPVEAVKVIKAKRGKKQADSKLNDEIVLESTNVEEEAEKELPKAGRKRGKRDEILEPKDANTDEEKEEATEKIGKPISAKSKREPSKRDASEAKKPKVSKQLQNKTSTDYGNIDFNCKRESTVGKRANFKITSWNVDGIRSWVSKGGHEMLNFDKPDILCLQETRCPLNKLPEEVASIPGYHLYSLNSDKDGYAGVGIYTKQMAINVQYGIGDDELDSESRIITAEYERFYLICTYVPNAGRGLVTLPKKLKWNDLFKNFVKELDKKKPVIICGDMNVSHQEIDLANPKTNKKNAGFTQVERDGMTALLNEGFVDTFRHLYPDKTGAYTFWTYMMNCRAKNVGWRLDYFIVSERILSSVCDNVMQSQVYGSDHCPITLFLYLNGVSTVE